MTDASTKRAAVGHVVGEAARQVVERDDVVARAMQVSRDVRSDEAGRAGDQ